MTTQPLRQTGVEAENVVPATVQDSPTGPTIAYHPVMRRGDRPARMNTLKLRPLVLGMCCALLAAAPALAGTIRHDRDPQLYLNLGAAPQYASVGHFDLTKWEPGFSGAGTLIDDNWVLTAAHVFEGTNSGQFTVGGQTYAIERGIIHPKWNSELRRGYDLALVKLASPVAGVAPAPLYTGKRELNALATFVGFGRTGTGLTGATDYDALKRAGQNVIDGTLGPEQWPNAATFRNKLPKGARTFVADFDNPADLTASQTGGPNAADLEYLISRGDSGGGVFLDFGKGPVLAGVHSFAEIPDGIDDSDYGDITGHVRVSAHARWIRQMLKKDHKAEMQAIRAALRSGGLPRMLMPENLSVSDARTSAVVPEPTSIGAIALAALVLRRTRRR